MSSLSAFLNPASPLERQEVVISKRFQKEDGRPAPFVIRPLSQGENDELIRKSTRQVKVNGQLVEKLDQTEYGRRVVMAATVEPDFASPELCKACGTLRRKTRKTGRKTRASRSKTGRETYPSRSKTYGQRTYE